MKKNYILFIIAGVLALIALILFGIDKKSGTNVPLQNQTSQITPAGQEEVQEEETGYGEVATIDDEVTPIPTATPKPLPTATPTPLPTATPTPMPTPEEHYDDYDNWDDTSNSSQSSSSLNNLQPSSVPCRVFVGDERLQTLASYSYDDTDMWLCRASADAEWFLDTACPSVTENLTKGSTIIVSLGLSDLSRADDYVTIINTYAQTWKEKGCKVYFVSLGPVDSTAYVSNEDIMAFNTVIFNNTTCGFVDTYNYLASDGFSTTDGINYDGVTSQSMYDYIVNNI